MTIYKIKTKPKIRNKDKVRLYRKFEVPGTVKKGNSDRQQFYLINLYLSLLFKKKDEDYIIFKE